MLDLTVEEIQEGEQLLKSICMYYKKIYKITEDENVSIVKIEVLVEKK